MLSNDTVLPRCTSRFFYQTATATETADGIGRRAPRRGRARTLESPARCTAIDGGWHKEVPLCPVPSGRGYRLPRLTQRPRKDFGVAGKMPGDGWRAAYRGAASPFGRQPRVSTAAPHAEVVRGLWSHRQDAWQVNGGRHEEVPLCPLAGGRGYRPPRPTQRPREDCGVAGKMPNDDE